VESGVAQNVAQNKQVKDCITHWILGRRKSRMMTKEELIDLFGGSYHKYLLPGTPLYQVVHSHIACFERLEESERVRKENALTIATYLAEIERLGRELERRGKWDMTVILTGICRGVLKKN
jgi:hypothetical protein